MAQTIYSFLNVFHLFWVVLILGGFFVGMVWKTYMPFHTTVVSTTICGQILFLGCPIVYVQQLIRKNYMGANEGFTGSFTGYLLDRYFGFSPSPLVVAGIVAAVLVLNLFFIVIQPRLNRCR